MKPAILMPPVAGGRRLHQLAPLDQAAYSRYKVFLYIISSFIHLMYYQKKPLYSHYNSRIFLTVFIK